MRISLATHVPVHVCMAEVYRSNPLLCPVFLPPFLRPSSCPTVRLVPDEFILWSRAVFYWHSKTPPPPPPPPPPHTHTHIHTHTHTHIQHTPRRGEAVNYCKCIKVCTFYVCLHRVYVHVCVVVQTHTHTHTQRGESRGEYTHREGGRGKPSINVHVLKCVRSMYMYGCMCTCSSHLVVQKI